MQIPAMRAGFMRRKNYEKVFKNLLFLALLWCCSQQPVAPSREQRPPPLWVRYSRAILTSTPFGPTETIGTTPTATGSGIGYHG